MRGCNSRSCLSANEFKSRSIRAWELRKLSLANSHQLSSLFDQDLSERPNCLNPSKTFKQRSLDKALRLSVEDCPWATAMPTLYSQYLVQNCLYQCGYIVPMWKCCAHEWLYCYLKKTSRNSTFRAKALRAKATNSSRRAFARNVEFLFVFFKVVI
jgi:hypothetical protein